MHAAEVPGVAGTQIVQLLCEMGASAVIEDHRGSCLKNYDKILTQI
jgi:hypothetical protein